jgi:hypothetical protein
MEMQGPASAEIRVCLLVWGHIQEQTLSSGLSSSSTKRSVMIWKPPQTNTHTGGGRVCTSRQQCCDVPRRPPVTHAARYIPHRSASRYSLIEVSIVFEDITTSCPRMDVSLLRRCLCSTYSFATCFCDARGIHREALVCRVLVDSMFSRVLSEHSTCKTRYDMHRRYQRCLLGTRPPPDAHEKQTGVSYTASATQTSVRFGSHTRPVALSTS